MDVDHWRQQQHETAAAAAAAQEEWEWMYEYRDREKNKQKQSTIRNEMIKKVKKEWDRERNKERERNNNQKENEMRMCERCVPLRWDWRRAGRIQMTVDRRDAWLPDLIPWLLLLVTWIHLAAYPDLRYLTSITIITIIRVMLIQNHPMVEYVSIICLILNVLKITYLAEWSQLHLLLNNGQIEIIL